MVLQRDLMVFNSISITNLNTQLMVRDLISRCILFTCHMMEIKLSRNTMDLWLLPWDLFSLHKEMNLEVLNNGRLILLTNSSILYNGLTAKQTQLSHWFHMESLWWWLICKIDGPTEDLSQLHHVLQLFTGMFWEPYIHSNQNILNNSNYNSKRMIIKPLLLIKQEIGEL